MNQFQNDLQHLDVGEYHAQNLVPCEQANYTNTDPNTSRLFGFVCFGCFRCAGCVGCGGCGGCGGCAGVLVVRDAVVVVQGVEDAVVAVDAESFGFRQG